MNTEFESENLKGRNAFGDLVIYWRIILKFVLKK
jgi:hypothetical protein